VTVTTISYEDIFQYSDIFNPISLQTLHSAGKLAQFSPEKTVLDLGCGKSFASLFWASRFAICAEGLDVSRTYVDSANARASLLNLSSKVQYRCQDIRDFVPTKKYDAAVSLGIEPSVYGDRTHAFSFFRNLSKKTAF
jgi:cyclopropane fatty-acyl-phospholipid synthase-like methyltransferase